MLEVLLRYRRWVLLCLLTGVSTDTWSQLENITISDEVKLARLYAGLLGNTSVSMRDASQQNVVSFQAGAMVYQTLVPEKILLRGFASIRMSGEEVQDFSAYELILRSGKKWEAKVGVMATPTTLLRPNPTTWESQVETNAQKSILGGRPGLRLQYKVDTNLTLMYGLAYQNNEYVQHVKLAFWNFSIASYRENERIFLASQWKHKGWEALATFHEQEFIRSSLFIPINSYKVYFDFAGDNAWEQLEYAEVGIRKYFSSDSLPYRGFFSLAYDGIQDQVWGGLFIHL